MNKEKETGKPPCKHVYQHQVTTSRKVGKRVSRKSQIRRKQQGNYLVYTFTFVTGVTMHRKQTRMKDLGNTKLTIPYTGQQTLQSRKKRVVGKSEPLGTPNDRE